jgi:hypothetical protein
VVRILEILGADEDTEDLFCSLLIGVPNSNKAAEYVPGRENNTKLAGTVWM